MMTTHNNEPSFPDPVYQKVKDWAAQQEAFEKENKAPAPLTDVQREFLDGFRARPPLVDVGQDFVSLLCSKYPLAFLRAFANETCRVPAGCPYGQKNNVR